MADLTLPLIGLTALVGYFFNKDGKNPRTVNTKRDSVKIKPNGNTIYTSNVVNEANDDILERSYQNYKKADNPSETGYIPPLFNAYGAVGSKDVIKNNDIADIVLSSEQLGKLNDINRLQNVIGETKLDVKDVPMFKSLIVSNVTDENYAPVTKPNESVINYLTGLPYEQDHNNMVPFFGGSVKQNVETFSNESLMDNRTGNVSTFKHKQEAASFYDKSEQNIYGAPVFTEQIDLDRYIPSLYKQNQRPIEPKYISAPIAGTIDNPIDPRSLVKTVDELRVASNPKETYEGRIIPGQFTTVRGIQATVEKRRPDTFYEATEDHLFRGPGQFVAIESQRDYSTNFKETSRQDYNLEYYGSSSNAQLNKTQQRIGTNADEVDNALFATPRRQNFENDYIRNVAGNKFNMDDYGKCGYRPPEQERDTTSQMHLVNANRADIGSAVRPLDEIKSTIRQTTSTSLNKYSNVKTSFDQGFTDAHDAGIVEMSAKNTNKQSMVDNKYISQPKQDVGMGYAITKFDMENMRNPLYIQDYLGNAGGHDAETSRDKYSNVYIRDHKQDVLMGERPSGPQQFPLALGKDAYGDVKQTWNMQLREGQDSSGKTNMNIPQNTPSKEFIGSVQKDKFAYEPERNVLNTRFEPELVANQLKDNPYALK
jgi:hypothetical protein